MKPNTPGTDAVETQVVGLVQGFDVASNLPILVTLSRREQIEDHELDYHLERIQFPASFSDQEMISQLQQSLPSTNVNPQERSNVIAAFEKLLRRRASKKALEAEAEKQARKVAGIANGIPEMVIVATAAADASATLPVGTDILLASFFTRSLNVLEKRDLHIDMATQYDTLEKAHAALESGRLIQAGTAEQRLAFIQILEKIKEKHVQSLCASLRAAIKAMDIYRSARELLMKLNGIAHQLKCLKIQHGPMTGNIQRDWHLLKQAVDKSLSLTNRITLRITNDNRTMQDRLTLRAEIENLKPLLEELEEKSDVALQDLSKYFESITPAIQGCDAILGATRPEICSPELQQLLHESRRLRHLVA